MRIATPAVRAAPAAALLTACLPWLGRWCGGRSGPAAPERQADEKVRSARRQMASPDKIGNWRGQDKCFSRAELERRPETHRPVGAGVLWPIERLGDVEPQHHEAQEVHADRAAPAAQGRPVDLGILPGPVPNDA